MQTVKKKIYEDNMGSKIRCTELAAFQKTANSNSTKHTYLYIISSHIVNSTKNTRLCCCWKSCDLLLFKHRTLSWQKSNYKNR